MIIDKTEPARATYALPNIPEGPAMNAPWEIKRAIEVIESYDHPFEATIMAALGLSSC